MAKKSKNVRGASQPPTALQPSQQRGLAVLEQAAQMLAEATTFDEVKAVRDRAETARTFARAAQLGLQLQNRAAELKLRAERKAGEFLAGLPLRGGSRKSNSQRASLKLDDLGINKDQSSRWQLQALVPEKEFEEYLSRARTHGVEITVAGMFRSSSTRRGSNGQAGKKSGSGERSASDANAAKLESLSDKGDLLDELRHHQAALMAVLTPFMEGEGEATVSDRRLVRYLLGEFARIVEELTNVVSDRPSAQPREK